MATLRNPLVADVVRLCAPPPVLSVSEWADRERVLPESSAARGARYRTSAVPYLKDVMDMAAAPGVRRLVVMKSHQCGASEALYNVIGYHVQHAPCPMLMILPTADAGQQVAKERLGDMFRACPSLQAVVTSHRSPGPLARPESTLNLILFEGGFLGIGGANSPNAFARAAVRIAIGDDADRFPATVGDEGDPADLLANRTTSFYDGRVLFVSTPTRAKGRIDSLYAASDQRRFHLTCPNCHRPDWLTWSDMQHWSVRFDEQNPATARLECPGCHHAVREPDRMTLVRAGQWRATNPMATAGHVGFHVPGMLSPFVSLPGLVASFLDATQRGREALRAFVNTSLAEAWTEPDDAVKIGQVGGLMESREAFDTVPMAASWITGAVDVQDDRYELLFIGWGPRDEAWVLHHQTLHRDDGYDPFDWTAWQRLYHELVAVRFEHESGVKLPVCTICVDSGYQTMLAYKFTRLDRRHLYATKGVAALTDGHFIKYSQDRDSATGLRRGVPLVLVDTNVGKQRVADRVREHRLHFPVADWAHEEFFEQLVAEEAQPIWNPVGIRVGQKWVKQRPRNEILDLVVLNYAARQIRATADLNAYRRQVGLPSA